jgi:hypothetical protein
MLQPSEKLMKLKSTDHSLLKRLLITMKTCWKTLEDENLLQKKKPQSTRAVVMDMAIIPMIVGF